MNDHLDDALLNEYLDGALAPAARASADAHLDACPACSTRLARYRALFADLEALPDAPLTRDLAAAVTVRLRPRREAALRPALRWAIAAQAVLGAVLLAVAARLVLTPPVLAEIGLAAQTWAAAGGQALAGLSAEWSRLQAALAQWWSAGLAPAQSLAASAESWSPLEIGLLLGSAAALGLLGNGLLLRSTLLQRRQS